MQTISTCLWFDFNAEEAVAFYLGIFRNSRVRRTLYYGDETPAHTGKVLLIQFELAGQEFEALNGGPQFPFSEAVSLVVKCDSQEEVDDYWQQLVAGGGRPVQCGWLKDRFGFNWQIVPRELAGLLADRDRARASRVMQAMLKMIKIDITELRAAATRQ